MTNYLRMVIAAAALVVVTLGPAACSAAENPAPARPGAPPPAQPAPAAAAGNATPTASSSRPAPPRYVQAPGGSTLTFTFVQAGASNTGTFKQFATELRFDENNLAGSTLKVTVQIGSLATGDKDRDDTLKSADLIDAQKYPTAQFQANSLTKNAGGAMEAAGKLTLRGVTRDLRVPLSIHTTATGLEISGETTIRRLDYGIGQGEWQSTGTVGDTIKLQYKVQLSRAG